MNPFDHSADSRNLLFRRCRKLVSFDRELLGEGTVPQDLDLVEPPLDQPLRFEGRLVDRAAAFKGSFQRRQIDDGEHARKIFIAEAALGQTADELFLAAFEAQSLRM